MRLIFHGDFRTMYAILYMISAMKIDRIRFPNIPLNLPEGAALNENHSRGVVYVYTEKMTNGERKRLNIAKIDKDGNFSYLPGYLRDQENRRLHAEVQQLRRESEKSRDSGDAVAKTVDDAALESGVDARADNASLSMNNALACSLMAVLGGANDCQAICDYIGMHCAAIDAIFGKNFAPATLSRESLRRLLFMVEPRSFEAFASALTEPLLLQSSGEDVRVVSADGHACRASGKRRDRTYYLMNVWDSEMQALIGQQSISEKTNEITVLSEILTSLNLQGAVLTADALNTQVATIEAIQSVGADYCLAVKQNHKELSDELLALFNGVGIDKSHIKTESTDVELGHERIEQRITSVIPGRYLSRKLRDKWPGLGEGVVVKTITTSVEKKSGICRALLERYFICSLPPVTGTPRRMGEIVRKHLRIENNLHYVLDVQFDQDRMNATNATFTANMNRMKKLVLGLLYRERAAEKAAGKAVPLKTIRQRSCNPTYAVELLHRHLVTQEK